MKHVVILIMVLIRQVFIYCWYSPILFAKSWTAGTNQPPEHLKEKNLASITISVAGSFLYIYFLSWLLIITNTQQFSGALKLAFITWGGMILPTLFVHYKFLGYPWSVVAIDSAKELCCAIMTAAILFTWQ